MEQRIYDKTNGLWYERHGDYYFPLLGVSAEQPSDDRPISKYANMHLRYLKEHAPHTLNMLTLNGTLHDHLTSIERDAQSRMDTLICQMKAAPLFQLAIDKDMKQEASAFSLLGTALYELRTHIQHLQTEHESIFCGFDASSTQ